MKKLFLLVVFLLFSISQFAYGAKLCTVTGCRISTANLRSGPGTRYQKVGSLYQGYLLDVLAKKGSWYKVRVIDPPEGKTGWVRNNLVTFK